jgi:hypothetical protein
MSDHTFGGGGDRNRTNYIRCVGGEIENNYF